VYSEDSEVILERMLNNVPSDIDRLEGSFIFDALSPVSEELYSSKIQLDEVLKRVFAQTACDNGYSEELEKRVAEFGITRKSGTKATGQIIFVGSEGTIIPEGTLVQSGETLLFHTVSETTIINGVASATIEAEEIGAIYNLPANTITEMPIQVTGITSLNNTNIISGGTDQESDIDLLNRYLLRAKVPATSGNISHYRLWATEIDGVGDAIVIPTWNGPGTVKVVVLDSNDMAPSQTILDAVRNHIDEERPIGATVTVIGAIEVPLNITANLTLTSGTDINTVKALIENSTKEYLSSLAFRDPIVRYTRIANLLLDISAVIDYSNLTVNNGTANISIAQGSVAVLGTVNVSAA
jgi:uncharacterized phage protein gp47/JayE